MKIPLLDLRAQYQDLKEQIDDAMSRVVEKQAFVLSGEVTGLEEEVARYCGTSGAVGVASGTDALILSLRAAGIDQGDTIITTPFTFFATAEAISLLGAKPLFVDIDPKTYNIDPDKIKELLHKTRNAKRTTQNAQRTTIKAIIPVHLYGQCADMGRIMHIADEYGLKVIEDAAQAIGATHKGRRAGSFGDTGCLSFFPSKNLGGFGDGGMVVSSDEEIIKRIKKLRVHGSREQYIHEEIGYNSRLDSLQAAILREKLKKLDAWLDARRCVAEKYNEAFSKMGFTIPAVAEGNTHTYHQYTLSVDDRGEMLRYLNAKGIAARVYYPVPLHLQPCYKDLGNPIGSFPVSEKAAERVISLPVYPELSEEQIEYIIETVKNLINKAG